MDSYGPRIPIKLRAAFRMLLFGHYRVQCSFCAEKQNLPNGRFGSKAVSRMYL